MRVIMNISLKYCIIFQSYTEVKQRAFMPSKPAQTAQTAKKQVWADCLACEAGNSAACALLF